MTEYLLDTNVVCEPTRKQPEPCVLDWLRSTKPQQQYVSVLTIGEIRRGITEAPSAQKRVSYERWLEQVLKPLFSGRILAVDSAVAETWGRLAGEARREGRPLPAVDGLLAATALVHGLTVATRNARDFARTGVATVDPWKS